MNEQDEYFARRHAERETVATAPQTKRVYIAGPMTGYEHYNYAAFDAAAFLWGQAEWDVVTPFDANSIVWQRRHGRDFDPYSDKCDYGDPIMREMLAEDMAALCGADAVAFLPGWEKSKGALLEYSVAKALQMPCHHAVTREPLAPPPESICQEADRLVSGDRMQSYGHPFDDYTRTGALMGALLWDWAKQAAVSPAPLAVPPHLAVLCMVAVKMSREVHGSKRDNRTDMAGYAKCLDMVRERQHGA